MKCFTIYALVFYFCAWTYSRKADGRGNNDPLIGIGVYDLRCQSLVHPVGIGDSIPVFSWKLSSGHRGVMQVAYQICVATSLNKLAKDPDKWNSGKIMTDQTTFIRYNGKLLSSAKKFYWKVKVWTNISQAWTDSKPSYFITGLLKKNEWNGSHWIAYEAMPDSMRLLPGDHGNGNQSALKAQKRDIIPCFRKPFMIKKKISHAYAFVCGLGEYALFINGNRVDSALFSPAWSDYTKRCYYNSFDVTSCLKKGVNVLGAIVGNGFLYINNERYHKLLIAGGYPMLRLKMVIRYTDGSTEEITTDKSWKTAPSAITYSSIYGGEDFDENKMQPGWARPGFNDQAWKMPMIVPGPGGVMQAQESYPVRINEVFHAVHVDSAEPNIRTYDFGNNSSGIVRLDASGPKGYHVRIIPSELVNADNTPDQNASGSPYYWDYTLDGTGKETWQPLFSYYGFRYAAVRVFDSSGHEVNVNNVKIDALTSLHTQNGSPRIGDFSCSDTLFNEIFSLILWGIRNNMSDVATDCPHREKLGWLEESHLMGNSIQYNYDILRFYSKITADMRDAQLPNGLVPDIAPEYVVFSGGFRDSPEWGSACVLVPWYVYKWYGDMDVLRKNYTMMKKYLGYLSGKANHHLLAYGLGDWFDLGPGGPGVSQLTPLGLTATAFYYCDARVVSKIAVILHDTKAANHYALLADTVRHAFNAKYFNAATRVYATGSQTAYAIPLYFGLAPEGYRRVILNNLVDSIISHKYALTAGDIGFRYLIQALEEGGFSQIIFKMNNRKDVPGYGYQISKGATSLTESWRALRSVSNDHMMLGHLMEWFYSGLGGIRQQQGAVGYNNIRIAPQFVDGITWVNVSYNSIHGPIVVKWNRVYNGKMHLQVNIPANTRANIVLPVSHPEWIQEGRINGVAIRRDDSMRIIRENGSCIIETGSGKYDFYFPVEKNISIASFLRMYPGTGRLCHQVDEQFGSSGTTVSAQ